MTNRDSIKKKEAEFWDKVIEQHGEFTYYWGLLPVPDEKLFKMQLDAFGLLGDIEGKKVLDVGCGAGGTTCYLSKQGADVDAIDISPKNVEQALKWCKENNVEARIRVMDCEKLEYSDQTFDSVSGSFLLHHVDTHEIASEIKRVTKPGGKAVFIETFASNPLLMFFRDKILPLFKLGISSDDEYPLTQKKIQELETILGESKIHTTQLVLFRLIASYFFRDQHHVRTVLSKFDTILHKFFPFLRKLSYYKVIEFSVPKV